MRRILLGLPVALLTFAAGAFFFHGRTGVVPSSGSFSWRSPDRELMTYRWEIFPSPSAATEQFNEQLRRAEQYREFTPCLDAGGRRVGERAVMLFAPPAVPEPTWRVVWVVRADDSSELFWSESKSLPDALYFETVERPGGKRCAAPGG